MHLQHPSEALGKREDESSNFSVGTINLLKEINLSEKSLTALLCKTTETEQYQGKTPVKNREIASRTCLAIPLLLTDRDLLLVDGIPRCRQFVVLKDWRLGAELSVKHVTAASATVGWYIIFLNPSYSFCL